MCLKTKKKSLIKTPLAGDSPVDSPGAAAADAWNKPLFVVCCLFETGSFGSRGRVDANDSAEAAVGAGLRWA